MITIGVDSKQGIPAKLSVGKMLHVDRQQVPSREEEDEKPNQKVKGTTRKRKQSTVAGGEIIY